MALTPALTRLIRRPKVLASLGEVTPSSDSAGPTFDVSNHRRRTARDASGHGNR